MDGLDSRLRLASLTSSPAGRTTIDPGLGLYWVLSTDGTPLMVDIPWQSSKDDPAAGAAVHRA